MYLTTGPTADHPGPQMIAGHDTWVDALRHASTCVAGEGNRIVCRLRNGRWWIYRERK